MSAFDWFLLAGIVGALAFMALVGLARLDEWLERRRDARACGCTTCDLCGQWEGQR